MGSIFTDPICPQGLHKVLKPNAVMAAYLMGGASSIHSRAACPKGLQAVVERGTNVWLPSFVYVRGFCGASSEGTKLLYLLVMLLDLNVSQWDTCPFQETSLSLCVCRSLMNLAIWGCFLTPCFVWSLHLFVTRHRIRVNAIDWAVHLHCAFARLN